MQLSITIPFNKARVNDDQSFFCKKKQHSGESIQLKLIREHSFHFLFLQNVKKINKQTNKTQSNSLHTPLIFKTLTLFCKTRKTDTNNDICTTESMKTA